LFAGQVEHMGTVGICLRLLLADTFNSIPKSGQIMSLSPLVLKCSAKFGAHLDICASTVKNNMTETWTIFSCTGGT
jgi:hypothetical protein